MSTLTQQEIATPDTTEKNHRVRSQNKFGSTKYLTYTAVFAALALIMKFVGQFLTLTPSFKITLIYTVWLIGGAVLGPLAGGAICFISDVLGAFIFPTGAINPLLVAGNTLYGVLAALTFKYTPSKRYAVKFIAAGVVCTAVCTCIINSLAIWYWYGIYKLTPFWAYFASQRAMQPLVALINIIVTVAMIPLLMRIRLLPPVRPENKQSTIKNKEKSNA